MKEIKNLSKIKLFLGIVIIAVAMFIFMPNNVFATTDYEIYVNGEQFTSEKTTINCGDGTATFDISTNTLILNNATITKRYGYQYAVINSEISNLTIQLIGNNVIDGNKGEYDGIGADGGSNVVIVGDGNLTMKDVYYGTYIGDYSVPGGNLKINNTTINIENAQATGIWVNHDLEIINSNIKIDKTGDDVYFGIVSNIGGTITIDGGNLDINTNSHCILLGNGDNSNHNVVIKSGNIKLNSRRNGAYGIKFEPVLNTDTINGNIKIGGGNLEISAIAGGTNIDDSKITINSKLIFLKGTSLKDNGKILLNEAKNYTIIYNCNGGSSIESQIVLENSAIQQPTAPTKEGYTFAGWYSDSGLTQAFDFNTPISTDITLYAKWDVVIAAANATVTVPVAGEHPDFNPVAGDSSRYTVAFDAWYLHESPYPDLDANSVFEHGKYYSLRIRFTPNAGYQFDSNTVFTVNGKATLSFGGIGAREYSATAYAATYTVTYDANGGTGSMAQEFLTHDNEGFAKNYTFPQCGFTAPAGQEFDKWLWYYESNPGSTNEITPGQSPWISGNIVVKALWKTVEYNVAITGGTASVGAGTPITKATMGTTVTLTAGAAPSGQMFDKWVVNGVVVADANSATTTFVMPAGNVTATATYKNIPVVTYTVTFNANGGTGSMADATGVSGDYVLPVCGFTAPNGKQFKAWSVGGVEKAAGDTITVNANTTVTAIWENIPVTYYTVTFDSNGGSAVTAQSIEAGQKATKPADPTKDGYDFKGWTLNGSAYDFNTAVNGNITLVATWEQQQVVPTTYTVSFAANGGTGTMADATGISGEYTLPANGFTAPDGMQFKAWMVGGSEKAVGDKITVTANTTVTAVWENIPVVTYTVTFDANGGSVTPASAETTAEGKLTSLPTPTRSRYSFEGWYTAASGGTKITTDTVFSENTPVYAQWTYSGGGGGGGTTRYTVSFETNGGSKVSSKTVTRNTAVSEPTAPTKEGYTFAGWYSDKELKTAYDFSAKVTKSFTLYAKWTEKVAEPDKPTEPVEPIAPEWENPFTDVKKSDWFYANVEYAVKNKLMNGTTATTFAPNEPLTRAMLVAILYRAEGEPDVNKSIPFSDVDTNVHYANAVIWAQQNGIVNGVTENAFAPDDNITREQIATIMHRYAQYKGYDVSVGENTNILSYDDFDCISEYAIASMQYAVGSGLMKGKSDSTLNPLDNATRAEIAAILHRFVEANK